VPAVVALALPTVERVQLVRADHGSQAAVSVARRMVVAPHRDGGQAQWLERLRPAPGRQDPDRIRPSCHWPPPLDHNRAFAADPRYSTRVAGRNG
jgi:hypothetical protein